MNSYIDLHCERTQPGLFEEPLNVLSGALFLLVAFMLWKLVKQRREHPLSLKVLVFCCGLIGAGSITYHMVSKMWAAAYADALPIAITSVVFLYMLVKHILRLSPLGSCLVLALFVFINILFKANVSHAPDGYISLFPTLFFIFGISVYMFITKHPSARAFATACATAFVALFFRIIDPLVCDDWPYGTHFIWHGLMAGFFYLVLKEAILRYKKD